VLISLKETPSKSPQSISRVRRGQIHRTGPLISETQTQWRPCGCHIRCSFEIPALNAIENISNKNMGFFRVISG
jgi:hypothetical protein